MNAEKVRDGFMFRVGKLWEIAKLGSKLNQIHKLNLSCKDTKNKDIPHKQLRESFNSGAPCAREARASGAP